MRDTNVDAAPKNDKIKINRSFQLLRYILSFLKSYDSVKMFYIIYCIILLYYIILQNVYYIILCFVVLYCIVFYYI